MCRIKEKKSLKEILKVTLSIFKIKNTEEIQRLNLMKIKIKV